MLDIAVSEDNDRFVSVGGDKTVFLWDVVTAKTVRRWGGGNGGHAGRVNCCSFGGEGGGVLFTGRFVFLLSFDLFGEKEGRGRGGGG